MDGMGKSLLNFLWTLVSLGGFIGAVSSGPAIEFLGPRAPHIISAVPTAIILIALWRNALCENPVEPEKIAETRANIRKNWKLPLASVVLLVSVVVIFVTSSCLSSALMQAWAAVGATTLNIVGLYVLMEDRIGKFCLYMVLTNLSQFSCQGAEFFFFTDSHSQYPGGPHVSPSFYTFCTSIQYIGEVVGLVFIVSWLGKGWTYRKWIIIWKFIICFLNVPTILLYSRVNKSMWISDPVLMVWMNFINGLSMATTVIPLWMGFTYFCPPGSEAITFGLLMGANDFSQNVQNHIGVLVLEALHVTPSGAQHETAKFDNLWIAELLAKVVWLVVSLLFNYWLPDGEMDANLIEDDHIPLQESQPLNPSSAESYSKC
jgi:hypothetical protein